MSTISDKLLYLNNTKQLIKDKINNLGGNLTSENTFRSYSDILTTIYKKHPKVINNDIEMILENTKKGKMEIELKSTELTQDGTPSPSNPVNVNVIKGDNNIKIQNRNLALNDDANNPDANYENSGAGSTVIRYDTTEQGFYTTTSRSRRIKLKEGKTYTFSLNAKYRTDGTLHAIYYYYFNSTTRVITDVQGQITITQTNDYTRFSKSFTIPNGYDGFRIIVFNGLYFKDIQIEEGSIANDYIEHQEQNYPITLSSKNLLDFNNITIGKLGTYGTTSVDGDIITFTANNQQVYGIEIDLKNLNLKPNTTYTISNLYENTGTFGGTNGWRYYDGSSYTIVAGQKTYFNFTTGDGTTNKLYFYLGSPTTYTGTLTLYNIQLLEGLVLETDIPDYQVYYNLEYYKIEEHADQLFKNIIDSPYYDNTLLENEWYLKKNIGKMIFNNDNVSYAGTWLGYNNITPILIKKDTNDISYMNNLDHPILCTKAYHSATISDSTDYIGAIAVKNQADYYYLIMEHGTTIAQARTALNGGFLYYQLVTPQYIHISQTDYPTLKQELDNLYNNTKSYTGTTNITQINDDLPFNLNAKALKKNDN